MTQFTIKAYPIGQVWGGMRLYGGEKADEIHAALHNFVPGNADDTKAAIILTDITAVAGLNIFLIFYFYGEPEPPTTGPFADFLSIDATLDLTESRSYADLVSSGNIPMVPSDELMYTVKIQRRRCRATTVSGLIQGMSRYIGQSQGRCGG